MHGINKTAVPRASSCRSILHVVRGMQEIDLLRRAERLGRINIYLFLLWMDILLARRTCRQLRRRRCGGSRPPPSRRAGTAGRSICAVAASQRKLPRPTCHQTRH
jgi:hypothetical protein